MPNAGLSDMETNGCFFPDDLAYTPDMYLWARRQESGGVRIGMTSALLWTAGKPVTLLLKKAGTAVGAGKSIGSIESPRFFETLRVPFECTITETNVKVRPGAEVSPRTIYAEHWFADVMVGSPEKAWAELIGGEAAETASREKVHSLRLHCFSELPDTEMVEIGSECSAILVKLSQLMAHKPEGFTVHLVTDDITSPIEMVRWSDETGNRLIETRKIENIYHFLAVKE